MAQKAAIFDECALNILNILLTSRLPAGGMPALPCQGFARTLLFYNILIIHGKIFSCFDGFSTWLP